MTVGRTFAAALAVGTIALSGCSGVDLQPLAGTGGGDFEGCAGYENASEAQRAWRDAGRPKRADRDGDGRVCESLSGSRGSNSGGSSSSASNDGTAKTTSCERPSEPVAVVYARSEYPNIAAHIEESYREGYGRVYKINRVGADERRDALLEGIPTRKAMDRDEMPPALGRTAATAKRASTAYVPSSENRSAGAVLGETLEPYCDGSRFRFRLTP